jgi:hypothetical protein
MMRDPPAMKIQRSKPSTASVWWWPPRSWGLESEKSPNKSFVGKQHHFWQ